MEGPRPLVKMKPDNLIQTNLSQERVEWAGIDGTRLAMASGKWGSMIHMLEIFPNKKLLNNLNQAPPPCGKPRVPSRPGSCPCHGWRVSDGRWTSGNLLSLALGPGRPPSGGGEEALVKLYRPGASQIKHAGSPLITTPLQPGEWCFHGFPIQMPPDTPEAPNSSLFLGKFHRFWL